MSSFIKTFSSIPQSFGKQVLSLTCHARLALASGPEDYELILRRTVREVKFYSEILVMILLAARTSFLISSTVACLLFNLIIYVCLETLTGESLHECINEFPCSRIALACITRLPALTVLYTLAAVGLSEWTSPATKIVLCIVASVFLFGLLLKFRVHVALSSLICWVEKMVVNAFKGLVSIILYRRRSKEVDLEEGKIQESESLPELKSEKDECSMTTSVADEKSISDMPPVCSDCV
ncbi:hypothetical protein PNOK_0828000 [Pyrrhoderma noxium]|uniref:Uncharacterized protein n=1 Tax=Pyrrhoderma noxium TaxID=2282107 RepID=A0A286UAR0_9AGAM|nr:hypothetical protein PNOK_0828000 [Pyrrhoderma noxium]